MNNKFLIKKALLGLALIASFSTKTDVEACGASNNTLIPELRGVFTPEPIGRTTAVSFLAEAGARNLRAGATFALYATPNQRFKASAEILTQKLKHHFFEGYNKKWAFQYALGAEYEYLLNSCYAKSVSAGLSYSHAYRKSYCSTVAVPNQIVSKRLSDSDGTYAYLDATVGLWQSAEVKFGVNYDTIRYHRHFHKTKSARGFGFNAEFVQEFCTNFCLTLDAEIRKPFNFYGGILNWYTDLCGNTLSLGLYGSYTKGKYGSVNAYTAGIEIGFAFGKGGCCLTPAPICSENWKCEVQQDLSCFARKPAVYMPVVLNVKDTQSETVITPG